MNLPNVVSRDAWLVARKELLAREKEATVHLATAGPWRPSLKVARSPSWQVPAQ